MAFIFIFLQTHLEVFTDEMMAPFLDGVHIKTDEERIREVIIYTWMEMNIGLLRRNILHDGSSKLIEVTANVNCCGMFAGIILQISVIKCFRIRYCMILIKCDAIKQNESELE